MEITKEVALKRWKQLIRHKKEMEERADEILADSERMAMSLSK